MSAEAAVQEDTAIELKPEDVVAFLEANPEFLQDNAEALAAVELEQNSEGAVSLIERQVQVLRDKNKLLENRLDSFIQAARMNDQVMERFHHLTLELAGHDSLGDLLEALRASLRDDFKVPFLEFILLDGLIEDDAGLSARNFSADDVALGPYAGIMSGDGALCGRLGTERHHFLFGDKAAAIRSAAVVSLQADGESIGLLAMGSDDETRFDPAGGTDLLDRLGQLIGTFVKHRAK